MKINRRGFFTALLAALLPKPKVDMAHWTEVAHWEPSDIGELDDISRVTLACIRANPTLFDFAGAPVWSGEIFPTYGSVKRNGTIDAILASKEKES